MRWMIVGMVVAMIAPLAPAQPQTESGQGEVPPTLRRGPGPHRGEGRGNWRISEEEWGQIEQFMEDNSPKRWDAYSDLSAEQQEKLKTTVARRYRMLQSLKNSQPDTYEVRLKRMRVEDEIFGLTRDLNEAAPTEKGKIEKKLESRFGKLVDLGMQEHQLRIARLQKLIAQEQDQLSQEQKNRAQIIEKHMKGIEKERGRLGGIAPATQSSAGDRTP